MSLYFSTLENLQMKNNCVICCSPLFQVGYCIWLVWPVIFFEFGRPKMCQGVALE